MMGMEGMDSGGIPAGRYVKPVNGATVSLVSDSLDSVVAKPENWLAKDFVALDAARSVVVTGPTDAQHWNVNRDSAAAEWKFTDTKDDEKLDTTKVTGLTGLLSSANIADVLAPGTAPEAPVTNVAVETFDGFHYDFSLGKEQGVNVPASVKVNGTFPKERTPGKDEKPEDKKRLDDEFATKSKGLDEKLAREKKLEGRTYLVPKSSFDALLKNRNDLLAPKPAPPAATPPPAPTVTPATPAVSATPGTSPVPSVAPAPAPTPILAPTPVPIPVATPTPVPSATPVVTPLPSATPVPSAPVTVTTPPMTATPSPVEVVSPPVAVPPVATPSQVAATPEPVAPAPTRPEPNAPTTPPSDR